MEIIQEFSQSDRHEVTKNQSGHLPDVEMILRSTGGHAYHPNLGMTRRILQDRSNEKGAKWHTGIFELVAVS